MSLLKQSYLFLVNYYLLKVNYRSVGIRFPLSWEINMAQHNELGKKGEQLAVNYLLQHGYTVIERNYRFDKAEVDIIAKKSDILAIVEVKTRSTVDYGNPQDFVKPKQIKNLVKAVDEYIIINDLDVEVRFDIIAIVKQNNVYNIEHLENAFYHF